ncbi:MAG: hypothetical protein ACTHMM_17705 [Agriterribacter sp.]
MKKLFYLSLFLFMANIVIGQTVNPNLRFTVDIKRKSIFVETPDQYFSFDTIRSYPLSGAILTSLHSGVWTAENLGIIPGTTNWLARLSAACNRLYVKEIRFTSDSSRIFQYTGKLNAMGVVFSFENGCFLRGAGSADTLINVRLKASGRDKIIDNIRLADGVYSENGEYSIMWNGVHPDSSSTANMNKIKRWQDFGKHRADRSTYTAFRFQQGEFWLRRTGAPGSMIVPSSYTAWLAAPNYGTTLKLDTAAGALINFSRFFTLGNGVRNVEIGGFVFDGSNKYKYYDSLPIHSGGVFPDGQNAFIFTSSSDSANPVRSIYIHDCIFENSIGDGLVISKNSVNITVDRCKVGGNLRQGIGYGGGFVNGVWVSHIERIRNKTYVAIREGGHDLHAEPADPLYDINISHCNVNTMAMGAVFSGSIDDVTTTDSSSTVSFNFCADMSITKSKFAGPLQMTPATRANIRVLNNSLASLRITTVSGYTGKRGSMVFAQNVIQPKDSVIGISGNNVDSVTLENNHVFSRYAPAIQMANMRSYRIVGNEATVWGTGNYENIVLYNSTASTYGNGVGFINDNYGYGPYRFLSISNRSDIIGPNNQGSAPTPLYLSGAKIFPYRDGSGRQVLSTTTFPNYHTWKKGDIINVLDGDFGDPTSFVIASDGALVSGYWSGASTYYINNYVRDTATIAGVFTTRYFRSKSSGGQAEKPMDDSDNTFWEQVATTEATYWSNGPNGMLISGNGIPEGLIDAKRGVIYINKSGDTCSTAYVKTTEGGNTGWRSLSCGGFSSAVGADSLTVVRIVNNLPDATIVNLGTGAALGVQIDSLQFGLRSIDGAAYETDTSIVLADAQPLSLIGMRDDGTLGGDSGVFRLNTAAGVLESVTGRLNFYVSDSRQTPFQRVGMYADKTNRRFYIKSDQNGGASSAPIYIESGGTTVTGFRIGATDNAFISSNITTNHNAFTWHRVGGNLTTSTAGTPTIFMVGDTIRQSGTSGYRQFSIRPIRYSEGSGSKSLMWVGYGGAADTAHLIVSNSGELYLRSTPLAASKSAFSHIWVDNGDGWLKRISKDSVGGLVASAPGSATSLLSNLGAIKRIYGGSGSGDTLINLYQGNAGGFVYVDPVSGILTSDTSKVSVGTATKRLMFNSDWGLRLFGTPSKSTNFEDFSISWSNGMPWLETSNNGTGVKRPIGMRGNAGGTLIVGHDTTGADSYVQVSANNPAGTNKTILSVTGDQISNAGTRQKYLGIFMNDYQTGNAGLDGLHISYYDSSTTTGVVYPISYVKSQFKNGEGIQTPKFRVDSSGAIFSAAPVSIESFTYVLVDDGSGWMRRVHKDSLYSGGGGGGIGSGTVNSGLANRLAYYTADGTTVDDLAAITANRALVSNSNGLPVASSTTSTQIGYISTLTGDVQTQLNGKQSTLVSGTSIKTVEGNDLLGAGNVDLQKSDVGLSNVDNTSDATKNSATATLTNKTISGSNNTLSNIPQSAVSALLDSLTALRNRITALQANVTISYAVWQDGDSLRFDFGGADTALYMPQTQYGIYNPSFPALTQVTSVSIDSVGYSRIGSSVQVWGGGTLSTTGSGSCEMEMTLPITTTFPASLNHVGGGGNCVLSGGGANLYITPVPGTNRVKISFQSTGASPGFISFKFGYTDY